MNILRARIRLVSIHSFVTRIRNDANCIYCIKKKTNVYKHKLIFELIEFLSKWNNIWGVK